MKKQLIIAAVAAMASAATFADISIKGDAHFQYGNINTDAKSSLIQAERKDSNATQQRVRLHVTGKSGDSTVKLGLRNDGRTRVSGGNQASEGADPSGSGAGLGGSDSSQLNVDYLYLTTKVGGLNIKAGDWWDTTGLGLARKGKADADRIEFSTKVGGWKLGFETGASSNSNVYSAIGKVGAFNVKFEHNTAVSLDGAAVTTRTFATNADKAALKAAEAAFTATPNDATLLALAIAKAAKSGASTAGIKSGLGALQAGKYTDISVKGKVGSIGIAAEAFLGKNDTRKAAGLGDDANAYVAHLWTKLNNITWHIAYASTDAGVAGITGSGNKFSPLGVSILGTAPGVNGAGAIGDFGNSEDTVYGVRADLKAAGMGIQVAAGNLELAKNLPLGKISKKIDGTFWDVIVTRPLGKGSNIKFSVGNYEDTTSAAVKIGV
ncbi:MAG: hypothetical protein HAW58_05775, partial [Candidatus Thioglobus sp.]|nr:hypothetical protein [Candidatus Thioglobus sp.]